MDTDKNKINNKGGSYTLFLLVVLFFFLFCLLVTAFGISTVLNLPKEAERLTIIDPGLIPCSADDVLNAYVFSLPNKPDCQEWVNNLVVVDNILFERDFIPQTNCCFFSLESDQKSVLSNPYIIIGNTENYLYLNSTLNIKPYSSNGFEVKYLTPPCDLSVPGCISFVIAYRFDQRYLGYDNVGVYKLNNFFAVSNIPVGDIEAQINYLDFYFTIVNNKILLISIRGGSNNVTIEYALYINDTLQIIYEGVLPTIILPIVDIANGNGFQPMAGFNSPASENARLTLTTI